MSNDVTAKTIALYNDIASQYAASIEELSLIPERDEFLSMIPKGGKILDVGCAAGRDSRYFYEKGFDVVGVDLSEKLLEIAKKKAPYIDFQKQDICSLDFPHNSFDGIYASAVLLHLKRDEVAQVIKNFYDLLTPKGVLLIQVKEGKGEADVAEKLSSGKSRHFTYFKKEEIENLLEQAGFIIERIHIYNEKDINPNWRDLVWISALAKK